MLGVLLICVMLIFIMPRLRLVSCLLMKKNTERRGRQMATLATVLGLGVFLTLWRVWRFPPPEIPQNKGIFNAACKCQSFACLRRAFKKADEKNIKLHKVPYFWLGGCQKCGTTSMYGLLARHPQIIEPEPKEPGYFAWPSVIRMTSQKWYIHQVLRLHEACDRGLDRVATFDATAYYLQWDSRIAQNIRASAPWAKAVFVFREPIARAMSWLQHMALKFPHLPNCLHYHDMACCVQQSWFFFSDHHLHGSLYYTHLHSWLTIGGWSMKSMHFVQFEDILEFGLAHVYANILAFLGLDLSHSANLTSTETQPANRRSTRPYNISINDFTNMVNYVRLTFSFLLI